MRSWTRLRFKLACLQTVNESNDICFGFFQALLGHIYLDAFAPQLRRAATKASWLSLKRRGRGTLGLLSIRMLPAVAVPWKRSTGHDLDLLAHLG